MCGMITVISVCDGYKQCDLSNDKMAIQIL